MTPAEFQSNHSGDLKKFFETNLGKEFISLLNGLRPAIGESFPNAETMIRSYAKVEGYELCLRNIVALTMPPKVVTQPEANYGVPETKPKEK